MADTDTDHISNEQLEAIGMSRDEWEKYTSYYADLMDDALDKPAPPSVWNLGGILPEIRIPKTDLIDDYHTFVEKLSKDPQIKNLFVEAVDRKYTPLGADPNMGFKEALINNIGITDLKENKQNLQPHRQEGVKPLWFLMSLVKAFTLKAHILAVLLWEIQ